MTRILACLWPLAVAGAACLLWPGSRPEAAVAGAAASALVLLAARRLGGAIGASHQAFLASFGTVFGLKALAFLGLCALSWRAGWDFLPMMGVYVAGVVGGTLAVGLDLGRAHAR